MAGSYDYVDIPEYSNPIGSPWNLIEGRFATSAEYASNAMVQAGEFTDALAEILNDLTDYTVPTIDVPSINVPAYGGSIPDVGDLEVSEFTPPVVVKPVLDDLDTSGITYEAPALQVTPPSIVNPGAPDVEYPETPIAPSITNLSVPAIPEYDMPNPPVIDEVSVPTPPNLTIPTFDSTFIEYDIPVPASFNWSESPYNSEIWATLLDKTLEGIINGGTGLDPDVEQAIFDRAKHRQLYENDKAYREVELFFSSRGFQLPPGAMAAKLQEVSQAILRENTDLNEKVMIEQAELAQKNTHFMLEMGRQAESILRDFHKSQEDRSLNTAKTLVDSSVAIVNAYVARYNAQVEKYRADAAIFKERVQAALAKVELYKAEMDGAKVNAEVQLVKVEIYKVQISAIEVVMRLYTTQLEGVKLKQQLEMLKVEIYKANTDVYSALINAEKLKVDVYLATSEAEKNKIIIYSEQIKAYAAEVDAKKTELQAKVAALEGKISKNSADIEAYKAEINYYESQVSGQARIIGAQAQVFSAKASAISSESQAQSAFYGVKIKELDVQLQAAGLQLQGAIAEINASVQSYVALKELQVKTTEGAMQVSAQLAASALSAVHASATYGFSGSRSESGSWSYGADASENHSIPHDPTE